MKVMFFSPAAYLWEHAFPEALVAESIKKSGIQPVIVRCRGILKPLCPAMRSAGLNNLSPQSEVDAICAQCKKKSDLIDGKLRLDRIFLDDVITVEDIALADKFVGGISEQRNHLSCEQLIDLADMDGLALGRLAIYEVILQHKKNDLEFSDVEWDEFLTVLRGCAIVALATKKILNQERPSSTSVYNSLYGYHNTFSKIAESFGIAQYFMHAGTNLSRQHGTLMIGRGFTWRYLRGLVERFEKNTPPAGTPMLMHDVTNHFLELLSARNIFVYSSALSEKKLDVRKHFGIRQDQILLVASTSSYDERFAVESVRAFPPSKNLLFPRQLDWVQALIQEARNRPDWFVLIRVHPREFPNRRESVKSLHVQQMEQVLRNLPENVRVNWPDEKISLYAIAKEANVFLNAWSSVGKEMALLGIPVVAYSPQLLLYPQSLNEVGETYDAYFCAIETAAKSGWSLARSRDAYRWYCVEFGRSLIDLTKSYFPRKRSLLQRALLKVIRKFSPYINNYLDIWGRRRTVQDADVLFELFKSQAEMPYDVVDQNKYDLTESSRELDLVRDELHRIAAVLFSHKEIGEEMSLLERNFQSGGILK